MTQRKFIDLFLEASFCCSVGTQMAAAFRIPCARPRGFRQAVGKCEWLTRDNRKVFVSRTSSLKEKQNKKMQIKL